MEVRRSSAASLPRSLLRYASAAVALSAVLVAPAFVSRTYRRAVGTVVLLSFLALALRGLFGAILAFRAPPDPPSTERSSVGDWSRTDDRSSSADPPPTADRPTVSVVVAAFDEAETLPATIEACRALDYPAERLEILLCYEAASTDDTARIAEEAATDSRFRAIERDEPPGGKAAIANFGLERATGDVVAFVDSGQRPATDTVRRAVAWFRSDEDAWCVKGRCVGTNAESSLLSLHATVERHLAERGEFFAREVLSGFTLFTGGFAVFRAAAFDALGPFDETVLLEDVEFASRIHAAGRRVRVDPGIVSEETNPETLEAWWNRRLRWARGGMQVARRYVRSVPTSGRVSTAVGIDATFTFGALLALPLVLLASPVLAVGYAAGGVSAATLLPAERLLVGLLVVSATLSPLLVLVRSHLDGCSHSAREYAAALTLPAYFGLEAAVVVAAFLAEFVLGHPSVYVPSSRPGEEP